MIIGVASPLTTPEQSSELAPRDQLAQRIGLMVASGIPHTTIARQLAKGDKKKAKAWRQRIRTMAGTNPYCQQAIRDGVQGTAWLGLMEANEAMIQRAKRGRMDAVRFLFAMTGAYNEKVSHEHSGDIAVTVKIARPDRVEDRTHRMDLEEGIIDAEVVEETD